MGRKQNAREKGSAFGVKRGIGSKILIADGCVIQFGLVKLADGFRAP